MQCRDGGNRLPKGGNDSDGVAGGCDQSETGPFGFCGNKKIHSSEARIGGTRSSEFGPNAFFPIRRGKNLYVKTAFLEVTFDCLAGKWVPCHHRNVLYVWF